MHTQQNENPSKNWQPDQKVVDSITTEIKEAFKTGLKSKLVNPIFAEKQKGITGQNPAQMPDEKFIKNCAKTSAFLLDSDAVKIKLSKLNELLNTKKLENPSLKKNILRDVLEEELAKFGFYQHFGKTLELVRPEIFRAAINGGLLIKDASIGYLDHGEYPHLIQWLLIAWQEEESHFLEGKIIDIFKQLGEESSVFYREAITKEEANNPEFSRQEKSMWDLVVDRLEIIDFRSPEFLNKYIINLTTNELDTLQKLIVARRDKRLQDEKNEYFTKKYNEAIDALSNSTDGNMPTLFYQRKHNKQRYRAGNLENILEPEALKIDLEKFKKKSY